MNCSGRLNALIHKYNVDKHMPSFSAHVRATEIAKKVYKELRTNEDALIIASDKADIVGFLSNINCMDNPPYKIIKAYEIETDDEILSKNILIVSLYRKDELAVSLLEKGITPIVLYDVFEQNGLFFQNDFYDILGKEYENNIKERDFNRIYFYHRKRLELAHDIAQKELFLEKMIFDCCMIKDFITLKKNIDRYINIVGDTSEKGFNYLEFYNELLKLLNEIAENINLKNKHDCVMFWIDALEYEETKKMTFFDNIKKQSIWFEEAYTVIPWTSHTLKTLFCGGRTIEEKTYKITSINTSNSILLQKLQERGYEFRYYGTRTNLIEETMTSPKIYNKYTCFTEEYWDMLCDMAESDQDKKVFYLLHEIAHTHSEWYSYANSGKYYFYRAWPNTRAGHNYAVNTRPIRIEESREYLNEQLKFWISMLPESMYKIYMSDHGKQESNRESYHVLLAVEQETLFPAICSRLFSFINFTPMILQILDNQTVNENILCNDYVQIENPPWYEKEHVKNMIKGPVYNLDSHTGYQGVITQEDMLICYGSGNEFYQKKRNDGVIYTDQRMNYLRSLVSREQVDTNEDYFRYSKVIIDAEKRCSLAAKMKKEKISNIIQNLMDDIPTGAKLAIRGGGMSSMKLIMGLNESGRRKVRYIIDRDPNCIAGKLGIEVIPIDAQECLGLDYVLIDSYGFSEMWEMELRERGIGEIINLYRILEKEGIFCTREFYMNEYTKNDFDISVFSQE